MLEYTRMVELSHPNKTDTTILQWGTFGGCEQMRFRGTSRDDADAFGRWIWRYFLPGDAVASLHDWTSRGFVVEYDSGDVAK